MGRRDKTRFSSSQMTKWIRDAQTANLLILSTCSVLTHDTQLIAARELPTPTASSDFGIRRRRFTYNCFLLTSLSSFLEGTTGRKEQPRDGKTFTLLSRLLLVIIHHAKSP